MTVPLRRPCYKKGRNFSSAELYELQKLEGKRKINFAKTVKAVFVSKGLDSSISYFSIFYACMLHIDSPFPTLLYHLQLHASYI